METAFPDGNVEQFARLDNYRGTDEMDLGNHVYACMVDNMVKLREEQTLVGQVDTRSQHSTASFIECLVGLCYAHATNGLYLMREEVGFIEVEPFEARKHLDTMWYIFSYLGFLSFNWE